MEYYPKATVWKRKAIAFLISQGITLFGSLLVQMAIVWHVTLKTSSGTAVMALTLCSFIPQLLISLFAGVWADRYDRKLLIIMADIGIAFATLILAFLLMKDALGQDELPAIFIISIIRSLGAGVQGPAVNAMIPQLVPEENLIRFNGINGSIQSLIQFGAPAVAGGILAMGPMHKILWIDILTAIIGVSILIILQIPKYIVSEKEEKTTFISDIKEGISFAIENKPIGGILLFFGVFIFLCVPSGFLTVLMIERTFGQNYTYLSINEIIGSGGMVLGGLLMGTWGGFKKRANTFALGILIYAVFSIFLGFTTNFWIFSGIIFFMCVAIPITQTAVITDLQEKVAQDKQGRIFSLLNIMFSGFMPLGMVVFGPLADLISMTWVMVGAGVLLMLLAAYIPFNKIFN